MYDAVKAPTIAIAVQLHASTVLSYAPDAACNEESINVAEATMDDDLCKRCEH